MWPKTLALLAVAVLPSLAPAQQNPLARPGAPAPAALNGRWNGVNLERRTACTGAQNEGNRGTYAQFDITADGTGNLSIQQSGITGLNCTYNLRYEAAGARLTLQGSYACTDGKQGTISSGDVVAHPPSLDFRLAIRLTAGETCTIDSIVSMARFP